MRRMLVWVPQGGAPHVARTAQDRGATTSVSIDGSSDDRALDIVMLHVPNRQVGDVVEGLTGIDGLHLSMLPQGVLALEPPADEAPNQVTDVTLRSPVEIFLSALQSIGSWRGFLSYAVLAGVVVWVGLYTNSVFLLTAAMLIAPFAEPAMNAAIGTARGDWRLLRRSIARYGAALSVAVMAAGVLSLVFGQEIATAQMAETANIAEAAFVLPLAAGAAGAINLSQSDRSSLVSGAATGMLVAAALAPPAGVVGMATVIGDMTMVRSALFLLGLQLVGINLAAAAVFRLVGMRPEGPRFPAGRKPVPALAAGATIALAVMLMLWQFAEPPELQRSTIAQRAESVVAQVVAERTMAELVEVDARFPRAQVPGQDRLLVTGYIEPAQGAGTVETDTVSLEVRDRLATMFPAITPLIDLAVVGS